MDMTSLMPKIDPLPDALATTLVANLGAFQSFARNRLHNEDIAADAVQESLYRALKSAPVLSDDQPLLRWFCRILRNVLIDLHRRQVAALERFSAKPDSNGGEENRQAVCRCLRSLLPSLDPIHAEVIQLMDLDKKSPAEVASTIGITPGNLKVRLHRARRQLRKRLEQTCQLCATHGCLDCTCEP